MKHLIIFVIVVFGFSLNSFSQFNQNDKEVGLFEHLNDTIPLNLKFYNAQGEIVTLGEIVDKPTVFSFVYFDCPGLCNPLLDGINDVVAKTDLDFGVDYQVVTISFNFQDTPEQAAEKKKNFSTSIYNEKAEHWKYLTTDSATINKILDVFGFKIKKVGVDWIHPSAIMIVSPEGKITRYLYGTYFLPFDLKMAIIEASRGISRPTINRVLEYCFSFDPQGQKYSLQITKVAATIIIAFALVLMAVLMIKPRKNKAK